MVTNQYCYGENVKSPVAERSLEEQAGVYVHYPNEILTEAGAETSRELSLKVIKRVMEQFKEVTFALFDDVLSTLKALRHQNYILGLLTNLNSDTVSIHRGPDLESYIDFVVT